MLLFHGADPARQGVETDEAFGMALVVHFVGTEGGEVFGVEAVRRLLLHRGDLTLVHLQHHFTVELLGDGVGGGDNGLAQRGEPATVIHQVGELGAEFFPPGAGRSVQYQLFHGAQCGNHHGTTRGLVAATGLHAHHPVLGDVDPAHAVLAGTLVQGGQDLVRAERLVVNGDHFALGHGQLDVFRLVRGILCRDGPLPDGFGRLVPGALQLATLGGDVPGVGVAAVDLLQGRLAGDVAGFQIGQQIFPGTHVPQPPRGDHFQLGSQGSYRPFEPHLVVALAGATVGDGISPFRQGSLDHRLGDHRTGHGGTQQVGAFIDGAGLQGRVDVLFDELFPQILDDALDRAGGDGLLLDPFQIVTLLAHVGDEGDDFSVIVLLQPGNDGRGIQSARVSQYDLVDSAHLLLSVMIR